MSFAPARQALHQLGARLPRRLRHRFYDALDPKLLGWLRLVDRGRRREYSLVPFRQQHCLFIHVPKTAGVSVCRALFGNLGAGHPAAEEYLAFFGARQFDRLFKFAVVRHPFQRLLSAYDFLAAGGMSKQDRRFRETVLSRFDGFEDFVLNGLAEAAQTQVHFVPQWWFVLDPRTNRPAPDLLIRFENLEEDFATVAHRLNRSVELPRMNVTKASKADWSDRLTPRIKEAALAVYGEDFALLGYEP